MQSTKPVLSRINTDQAMQPQGPLSAPAYHTHYYDQILTYRYPLSASVNPQQTYYPVTHHDHHIALLNADHMDTQVRKKRYKPTPEQVTHLIALFERDPLPSTNTRLELAVLIDMRPRAIQIWFQNRRAKVKAQAKERKNSMEFLDQTTTCPIDEPVSYPYTQRVDAPTTLGYQRSNPPYPTAQYGPSAFLNSERTTRMLTPIASPLTNLMQMQALHQQAHPHWAHDRQQAARGMQAQPLVMSYSLGEGDVNGYSADELLKFLEM